MLTIQAAANGHAQSHESEEATRQLYLDLQMYAPGAVSEQPRPTAIADKRVIPGLGALVVAGIKLGVFSGLIGIIKTWLENRPQAEVTLHGQNGSELKITHLTPKEAIELFAKQNEIH